MWLKIFAMLIPVLSVVINILYLFYDKQKLSRELEKYKSELTRINDRHSVQFSYIHVERAKLLRELYSLIVRLHEAIHIWTTPFYLPDLNGVIHKMEDNQKRIEEVSKYLNKLIDLYYENKILLPENLQKTLESIIEKDREICLDHKLKIFLANNSNFNKEYQNLIDASRKYDIELDKPLHEIESEFQKLLAVNYHVDD